MRSAFTIVEVVVTFVIMSILISFAIYSFRFSIVNIKKATYYMPKEIIFYSTIDRLISGIYNYAIEKNTKKFVDFFSGTDSYMDFVTVSPLFNNRLALARLAYVDKKLIYREEPLYTKNINFVQPQPSKHVQTVIFLKALDFFKISYILKNGQKVDNVQDQLPVGIELKYKLNKKIYHYIFSVPSNYEKNKVMLFNAKYPI